MAEKRIGPDGATYYVISGEIMAWAEPNGPLMIKTTNPHGDPVELNAEETRDLIGLLQALVNDME